ncbi:hypothetical protein KDA00_04005, partial [Candidatus Saccharibacteria bacterium]|nr:hypothetical protein [Candidatus Saccharibacteria bacterium]
ADCCGPLHVSGHCSLDEYMDMIDYVKPKFLVPIYGAFRAQRYHNDEAINRGFPRKNMTYIDNGEVISFTKDTMEKSGEVPVGTLLVDQTGALVSNVVIKDRLLLAEEGLVVIILTIDKKTGSLLTSPDIISRGFIYMRDSEELMNTFRFEIRRAVGQRFKRVELDRFKQEIKEHATHFLYEYTQRSPIVIPVVNVIGSSKGQNPGNSKENSGANSNNNPKTKQKTPEQIAAEQQQRFQEMRAKLLGQDARTD